MRLNEDEVLARLRRACEAAGGQRAWSRKHKMNFKVVNNTLCRRTPIGLKVANELGIRRIVKVEWEARDG